MPVRHSKSRARSVWTDDHFSMLRHGHDWLAAWDREWYRSPIKSEILADMEACWRQHGAAITTEYRADRQCHAGRFPWGWWQWTSPESRNESVPEWYQLWKLNLIDEAEAREAAEFEISTDTRAGWHGVPPFRRSMGFWCFVSAEPRNESICELSQLVKMRILTPREQQFLDGDEKAIRECSNSLRHLTTEECRLLGIPPDEETR